MKNHWCTTTEFFKKNPKNPKLKKKKVWWSVNLLVLDLRTIIILYYTYSIRYDTHIYVYNII